MIHEKLQNFSNFRMSLHKKHSQQPAKPGVLDKVTAKLRKHGDQLGKHISKKKDQEKTAKIQAKINKIAVGCPEGPNGALPFFLQP